MARVDLMQVKVIPDLTDSQIVQVSGMAEPGKSLGGQPAQQAVTTGSEQRRSSSVPFSSICFQNLALVGLIVSGPRDVVGASRHRAAAILPRRPSHHGQSVTAGAHRAGRWIIGQQIH